MELPKRSDVELERVMYSKLVREVQTAITSYDQRRNPTQLHGAGTDYTTPLAREERSVGWLLLGLGAQVLKRAGLQQTQSLPTKAINVADKPRRLQEVSAHLVRRLGEYYLPLAAGDDIKALTLAPEELAALERDLGPQLVKAGMLFLACADDRDAVTLDIAEPGAGLMPSGVVSGGSR